MWDKTKIYDVIVVGGGPSGFAAAVAAAREGASVLLLEQHSSPGGVSVACGCPAFMGCACGGKQLISGVGEELVRRLDKRGAVMLKASRKRPIGDAPILEDVISSEEEIALEMNRMLQEAGVDLLYYCTVYGVQMKGRVIESLSAFCANENICLRAKSYVDCTGDAVLAYLAKLPTVQASPDECMTKTLLFRVTGLEVLSIPDLKERFKTLCQNFPYKAQNALMFHPVGFNGDFLMNITLIDGDAFSPAELTQMDISLREQIPVIIQWLRENIPEFRNCVLKSVAPNIGIRNGRQLVGRECITCADLDANAPVAEPVALGRRGYGGHGTCCFLQAWAAKSSGGIRGIPYGALLSAECDNYVAGGRALSCEPKAITSIRLVAQCFATGQAAGIIAALNSIQKALPQYSELRQHLDSQKLSICAVKMT